MSAAHEELAAIYIEMLNRGHGVYERSAQGRKAADAILAAGYFKPREIPNEHLTYNGEGVYPVDFRPGMIVESADGSIWRYDEENLNWNVLGWDSASLIGPATVLYEGYEA